MRKISDIITKIEEYVMIVLMGAMLVTIAASVAFRYFLNAPLSWAGEVSVFLLIWLTFLGGSWGLKFSSQASVSFLMDKFEGRNRKILEWIQMLAMIVFLVVILYFSFKWILLPSVAAQRSSSILLPMWIPYSAVPIGLSFAFIHLVARLTSFSAKKEGM